MTREQKTEIENKFRPIIDKWGYVFFLMGRAHMDALSIEVARAITDEDINNMMRKEEEKRARERADDNNIVIYGITVKALGDICYIAREIALAIDDKRRKTEVKILFNM